MDVYDTGHTMNYHRIINIYNNDSIEDILPLDFNNEIDVIKQVENTVRKLRSALSVLDSRTITNIGGRLLIRSDSIHELGLQHDCYLIQVWRCDRE